VKISDRTDPIERDAIRLEPSFLEILCLVASLCLPDSEGFCHSRWNGRAYGSLTARGGGLPGSSYLKIGWYWVTYALTRGYELYTTVYLCSEVDPEAAMASKKQDATRRQSRFVFEYQEAA